MNEKKISKLDFVPKLKILIIEDEACLSQMYSSKLKLNGFETIVCQDGESGLLLSQKEKPDLILLDIILPKLDGFFVLKSLKEDLKIKDIPIVLLTNLSQKNDIEKGLKLGAIDYLVKAQLTPQEVIEKIKKILKL